MGEKVRVAAVQTFSERGESSRNLEKIISLVQEAAANEAKIIVFPECMNSGYIYDDFEDALRLAEPVPGDYTRHLGEVASELDVYVAVGLTERGSDGKIYNSAVLIGPDGSVVSHYQKNFLFSFDKNWFSFGTKGFPVAETEHGPVGMYICADGRVPEPNRILVLNGAKILLNLTNWASPDQYELHVPTRTVENEAWTIAADKVGVERGFLYPGRSFIMSPSGERVAEASDNEEEIIYADIDVSEADAQRAGEDSVMAGRRPELYGLLTEPYGSLPVARLAELAVSVPSMGANVVLAQMAPRLANPGETLVRVEELLVGASKQRASIVVLPELFPFVFPLSAKQASNAAALSQAFLRRLQGRMKVWGFYLVASLVERESGHLYSAAYLLGPDGSLVGKYRKTHLLARERTWASAGEDLPVFSTSLGNVGILLGSEIRIFEAARVLGLRGADMLAVPSSWREPAEERWYTSERALENRFFVAAANRLDAPIGGRSKIVTPSGAPAAQGSPHREQLVKAYVNLSSARDKCVGPDTDVFRQRTPEAYGVLTDRRSPP